MEILNFKYHMTLRSWFLSLLIAISFSHLALASDNYIAIKLDSAEPIKKFGQEIYLVSEAKARVFTPGKKHIEIDKSTQTLRAYDEKARLFLETFVSTGEPGIDEEGWEKTETLPGFHKIVELKPFRIWSKDEDVKMLNWIGIEPGVEKGIHSLESVGKFAGYEKFLGKKKSHGCIRVSREASTTLYEWIGSDWKAYSFIVYIYEKPILRKNEGEGIMLFVQETGHYSYPLEFQDEPKLVKDEVGAANQFNRGDILIYKKVNGVWGFIEKR